jgi:glycosyltransferase involved in cell wall biosynthesis
MQNSLIMPTTNQRILIFSLSYLPLVGGAEIAVKNITDRISDFEFDMITMRFSRKHSAFEKLGNINIYRIGGGFGYLSKILFVVQSALFALKLNRDRNYTAFWAIMTYMIFPVTLARLLGNRAKYILTLQDGDPFTHVFDRLRVLIFRPLLTYGFRHAYKVQAISNYLAQWAREMGYRGEVAVIPNGVDTNKFTNVKNRAFNKNEVVLITTLRLVEKNGVGDIIDALQFLPESTSLKILGVGPLEKSLKLLTKSLQLTDRVDFLGFVNTEEIPPYLWQADIFVRPSLSEGFGNSFIEAMAAGLPVVATPVDGIVDFIKDEETGLFCEVKNPKSITRAVKQLIEDDNLRQKLIKNGRELAREKYDWDLIAREMKSKVFNTL